MEEPDVWCDKGHFMYRESKWVTGWGNYERLRVHYWKSDFCRTICPVDKLNLYTKNNEGKFILPCIVNK